MSILHIPVRAWRPDSVPAAIGMLAEFVEANCSNIEGIELFKFPNDLSERFENENPDAIGFSNYVWNYRLSYRFIEVIRKAFPDTTIVWGGPNAPSDNAELKQFLEAHPAVDFYLVKEAEIALAKLISQLQHHNFNLEELDFDQIPNLVYRSGGEVYVSSDLQRVMDLSSGPHLSERTP